MICSGAMLNSVFGRRECGLPEEALQSNGRRLPPCDRLFGMSRPLVCVAVVAFLFAGQLITGGLEDHRMIADAAPAATQFPHVSLRTPLVSLEVVRAALRQTTLEVLCLIESGRLPWVFDVALAHGGTRRELRVLARCLADLQCGQRTFTGGNDEFPAVLQTIFPMAQPARPGSVPALRADTVARQLCIKGTHCLALADSGHFRLTSGTVRRAGPNGSPLVRYDSVCEFLKQRRVL